MPSDDERNFSGSNACKFQTQKLFIKNLNPKASAETHHQQLIEHFSMFGTIIDLKVLKSRAVIRESGAVRISDFQGGGVFARNPQQNPCSSPSKGRVTRSPSPEPRSRTGLSGRSTFRGTSANCSSGAFRLGPLSRSSGTISKASGKSLTLSSRNKPTTRPLTAVSAS